MNYNDYKNDLPYPRHDLPKEEHATMRKAYRDRDKELKAKFRDDIEAEYDMTGHPKADKLWELAWEYGHSAGYSEVAIYYAELVELAK